MSSTSPITFSTTSGSMDDRAIDQAVHGRAGARCVFAVDRDGSTLHI
jgi:hypothetical protein